MKQSIESRFLAGRLRSDKKWTLCVAPLISKSRIDRLIWGFDQMAVTHNGLEHIVVDVATPSTAAATCLGGGSERLDPLV